MGREFEPLRGHNQNSKMLISLDFSIFSFLPKSKNTEEYRSVTNLSLLVKKGGLGKTLQIIAVLLKLKEDGRFEKRKALVVVPTGLLANWQKECERFAPSLNVGIYHGPTRNLDTFSAEIMLTSYGVMRSDVAK